MRVDGWYARLAAVIEAARARAFVWGEHDCFRLACAAVEALTGEDRFAAFAGRYSTQRQALRIVAANAPSFERFVSWVFRAEPVSPRLAHVGDLVLVPQTAPYTRVQPMPALGVCLGAQVAAPLETELGFVARSACSMAWRIN